MSGLAGLAFITSLAGCDSTTQPPLTFQTHYTGYHGGHHMIQAVGVAHAHYGGIQMQGEADIDNDGVNDLYVLTKNGPDGKPVLLHTSSRRLLTGDDTKHQKMWYRNSANALD